MSFTKKEQSQRVGELALDKSMVDFLDTFNERLKGFDSEITHTDGDEIPPLIFVLGLPRSATTLTTQLLAANLDLGFISNVVAKFWEAPVAGVHFSKAVLGEIRDTSYDSVYGKTANPAGLHEFSYFWHKLFLMQDMPPYDMSSKAAEIDWTVVKETLHGIASAWGKPTVMKAFDVVFHLPKISEIIPRSLFVFVERDLEEVAESLAKGRLDYYGNLDTWLSMYPPEYESIKDLPWHEQIAGQVCSLQKMHDDGFSRIPEERVLRIPYADLCASPASFVDGVRERLCHLFAVDIASVNTPPTSLDYSTSSLDENQRKVLKQSLASCMSYYSLRKK